MKHHAIAIDGPSGAGKSTMAKAAAKELGYLYVDTGAIYRTVGYHMWLMGIGPKDADGIRRLIDDVNIVIDHQADGVQHMILNGMDVTAELRTPEMSRYASGVSAQPCVREYLLDMQRQFARGARRRHGRARHRDGRFAARRREDLPHGLAGGTRPPPL